MYRENFYKMLNRLELSEEEVASYFEKVVVEAIEEGTSNAFMNIIKDFPLIIGPNGARIVVEFKIYGEDEKDLLCGGVTSFEAGEDIFDGLEEEFDDENFEDDDELGELEIIGEIDGNLVEEMTEEEFVDFIREAFIGKRKNNEDLN